MNKLTGIDAINAINAISGTGSGAVDTGGDKGLKIMAAAAGSDQVNGAQVL